MKCSLRHSPDVMCQPRNVLEEPREYEHNELQLSERRQRSTEKHHRAATTMHRRRKCSTDEEPLPTCRMRRALSADREASLRDIDDFDRFCALAGFVRQNTEQENKLDTHLTDSATLNQMKNKENLNYNVKRGSILNVPPPERRLSEPTRTKCHRLENDQSRHMIRSTKKNTQRDDKKHGLPISICTNEHMGEIPRKQQPKSIPSSPNYMDPKNQSIFSYPTVLINDTEPDSCLQMPAYNRPQNQLSPQLIPKGKSSSDINIPQINTTISPGPSTSVEPFLNDPSSHILPKNSLRRGSRLWIHLRNLLEKQHYIPVNQQFTSG